MKKLSVLFLIAGLLCVSCTSARYVDVSSKNGFDVVSNVYEIQVASKSGDFFKVYRLNDTDYAICEAGIPSFFASDLTVEDLEKCLILSAEEALDFKDKLIALQETCSNFDSSKGLLAEVVVSEKKGDGDAEKTISNLLAYTEKALIDYSSFKTYKKNENAFKIQAVSKKTLFSKNKLEYFYLNKQSGAIQKINAKAIADLVAALEK